MLSGRRVEPRQAELGEQNQRFVDVVAGVVAGDRVMLVGDRPTIDAPTRDGELALEIGFGELRSGKRELPIGHHAVSPSREWDTWEAARAMRSGRRGRQGGTGCKA